METKTLIPNATNSAEIVASLDDILTQILLKLPLKPLIRSKLVSKYFLSLISSHQFCLKRNPKPNPAQGFFLCIKLSFKLYRCKYIPLFPNSFIPSINLGFTIAPSSTEILHSCNGLLLCSSSKKMDSKMYVYNPTTNLSITLPDLSSWLSATLAFNPVKSPYYKVVVITETCEIIMYSSETRGWSRGGVIGMDRCSDVNKSGVYWNGSIHWLNEKLTVRNPRNSIRFDVDTRLLWEMPSPPVVRDKTVMSSVYFGESCDHLHFVEPVLPRFNVYEMKRDYSEWFVKYKVDLSLLMAEYPEMIRTGLRNQDLDVVYVPSLVRYEKDDASNLVLRIPYKVIRLNLADGSWEKVYDLVHDKICHGKGFSENGVYWESCIFGCEYGLDYIQSLCGV